MHTILTALEFVHFFLRRGPWNLVFVDEALLELFDLLLILYLLSFDLGD